MRKRNHRMKAQPLNAAYLENVIANSKPASEGEVLRIMNVVRLCYEKLKAGNATVQDYRVVEDAMNIGLVRAEAIDPQLVATFQAAGEAMLECERIRRRHDKYGFLGPHLLNMNAAVDFYQQMLALSSPHQMHEAAKEVDRRIKDGAYTVA